VNYQSTSLNCRERGCLGVPSTCSHLFRGRGKSARHGTRRSAACRSREIVPVQPESQEWEALEEMFVASRSRFFGLAYTVLRNREDAEDALQDAVLSAQRNLRTFQGRSAFATWFTRIVLNAALMILRKRKSSRIDPFPVSSAAEDTPWEDKIPGTQPDPEMLYAEEETFQSIDALLEKMSPMLRQAFRMTYYDEMSTEEAGALLGVERGTFKSRIFRARQILIQQVQRSRVTPLRGSTASASLRIEESPAMTPQFVFGARGQMLAETEILL
jgi:RNA polymerase sigma-70 factor (ECF subfamily)